MRDLEQIRKEIAACDEEMLMQLEHRMHCINEIITYKRIHGIPILQPKQEEKQMNRLRMIADGNMYEDELLKIFASITEMSKRVQAKALIHGNIALIGFMGAGKTSVCAVLKDMLAMDSVECDDEIVERAGMSINDIFDKYGEEYFRDLGAGKPIHVPENYFPGDDPKQPPKVRWRAHANLLFCNWLNYFVYQTTPYDLNRPREGTEQTA